VRLQISVFYGVSCSTFGTVYNYICLLRTLTSKNLRQFTSSEIGCGLGGYSTKLLGGRAMPLGNCFSKGMLGLLRSQPIDAYGP
jgi:hypothetical protein